MSLTTKLSYKFDIPVSISPTKLQDTAWLEHTKNSVTKMITNLQAVVPDATAYGDNVVTPAVQQWSNYVNPAFVSKKGETGAAITKKMSAHMMDSADKYLNNVRQTLADGGKRYKEALDAKQANWANKQGGLTNYVLPVTGSHETGLAAIPFTLNALTGSPRAMRMVGNTVIQGSIIDVVKSGLKGQFKAAMNGMLVQLYAEFYYHLQTDDEINGKIALLANSFVNSAVCNAFVWPVVPASSALYYAPGGGNNQLCCQIVFGTP